MNDAFLEKTEETWNMKMKKFSSGMVEIRSQKNSGEERAVLELDLHPNSALDEN